MTSIVEEFLALKESSDADVLAMQVGDFYEFFAEDARLVASELDLQVSEKSSHGSSYPMAGVPLAELTPYLKMLVERGYSVAVADQRSSDDTTREIVRTVTPGTLLETTDANARYLAAVVRDGSSFGLAFADVTTGQFHVTTVEGRERALAELGRFDPAEVLPGPSVREDESFARALREDVTETVSLPERESFAAGRTRHRVREQFGEGALEAVGVDQSGPGVQAAGAVLAYVADTGVGVLASFSRIQPYRPDDHVALDATTRRNLELTETMHGDADGTLLETLDHTVTSMGARTLEAWLTRPSRDARELERRHESVGALVDDALSRDALREGLDGAADLERLASRTVSGSADPSSLVRGRETLARLPDLRERVESTPALAESPLSRVFDRVDADAAAALRDLLTDALRDDPSALGETGIIRDGYDEELDRLAAEHDELQAWFDSLADRVKAETELTRLTVDRNRTDGYYIQVGNSQVDRVPDEYTEIKSLTNSTRFVTEELEEKERALFDVETERAERERAAFEELRERVAERAAVLQDAGRAVAELDTLASLAEHATANRWTRPDLVSEGFEVEAGRHPVVEQTVEFVPNDAALCEDRRFLVVTGPNMSGKSTYMRQNALIALLAQAGSFVPAASASLAPVDGIYTRVGALDELAGGRSTFMVEMQELSRILHAATEDSLVVLDEVGRGTATYDGISIAWAATEYLHNEVRAKTLFATHYHELTALADHLSGVENVHVQADDSGDDVTFLHAVADGAADRSYGVHVADLAGVPSPVVDRAERVLDDLRAEHAVEAKSDRTESEPVQAVFDLESGDIERESGEESEPEPELDETTREVLDDLRSVDVNDTTPLDLLRKVAEWQDELDD
ncbi:DNA mismatch repair protein MutS [Halocalculus aciditolerans]|uniref:DNA mismatch repair protein MutS n=1 Tax=Halocalculus aciditolerans TaxID=1383812 RepID=A0A830F4R5_9EURY|nr:DNA mismatch repair protein MutS [Halocalculus aciditolerans]GGL63505.1 DNA mismatch repair protein MutS [Halocalculus aciditolerans]